MSDTPVVGMDGVFLFGKSAKFTVNSVIYDGKGWAVSPTVADLRTDNTADNGYSNRIGGISDCSFVLQQEWDASYNLLDDPPALHARSVINGVKLHLDVQAGGPYWHFPKALVLSTPMTAMVDGLEAITINCANKGFFALPTGTFTPSAPASS